MQISQRTAGRPRVLRSQFVVLLIVSLTAVTGLYFIKAFGAGRLFHPNRSSGVVSGGDSTAAKDSMKIHDGSAILDTVARLPASRAMWRRLADDAAASWRLIECVCHDPDLHRRRVVGRDRGIPGWYELSWADVEDVRSRRAPWSEEHLVVDAARPAAENLAVALRYVTGAPAGS